MEIPFMIAHHVNGTFEFEIVQLSLLEFCLVHMLNSHENCLGNFLALSW